MMSEEDNTRIETKKKAHALEEWLDIEEGSTESERIVYNAPSVKSDKYDPKDQQIEEEAHDIFQQAMTGYLNLEALIAEMEPKYRARMAEVSLQYLKTALDASDSKGRRKESIEKLRLQKEKIDKTPSGGSGGNKIIAVGDRNEFLKMKRQLEDEENGVIDVTPEKDDEESKDD